MASTRDKRGRWELKKLKNGFLTTQERLIEALAFVQNPPQLCGKDGFDKRLRYFEDEILV